MSGLPSAGMPAPPTALAILCGGGSLPFAVAEAVTRRGVRVVMFCLHGWADAERARAYPHHWIAIGQFGRFLRLAREEGCGDVLLLGNLVRPALRQIRLDFATLRVLPRIIAAFRGGDDHLLSGIAGIIQDHGFRLVGVPEVAPEVLMPSGLLGARRPSGQDRADIARALAVLQATGPFDVGQAVVVADNHVLALEAAEGTDGMLRRVAELRDAGRIRLPRGRGVLVKAPKPTQDRRLDLPSVGPQTIEGAAAAGLAGIAITAGAAVVAEPQDMLRAADAANLFVLGIDGGTP
jgi:DUF1009 family protein